MIFYLRKMNRRVITIVFVTKGAISSLMMSKEQEA
jgi:hypothetical protein